MSVDCSAFSDTLLFIMMWGERERGREGEGGREKGDRTQCTDCGSV